MRLPDDDEIYDVDQTYLGPPGYYIGRLRYRMIAVAPVLVMIGLAAVYRSGIGFSLLSVALTVLVALRLSQWIVNKTNHEQPIGVLLATFWHELTAARRPTRGRRTRAVRRLASAVMRERAKPLRWTNPTAWASTHKEQR